MVKKNFPNLFLLIKYLHSLWKRYGDAPRGQVEVLMQISSPGDFLFCYSYEDGCWTMYCNSKAGSIKKVKIKHIPFSSSYTATISTLKTKTTKTLSAAVQWVKKKLGLKTVAFFKPPNMTATVTSKGNLEYSKIN